MSRSAPVIVVAAVLLTGCQPQTPTAAPEVEPTAPSESTSSAPAAMTVVAMTDIYDANGAHQDQKIETAEATPESVTRMFNSLDWLHPTNMCGIALSRPAGTSPLDREKLGIRLESRERGEPKVLLATLQEMPPGESDDKFYSFEPLESPDVGLQLLLSFLAQDGKYRTMVEWQE